MLWVKSLMDRILGLAGLIVLSPLLIVISLAIKVDTPGPVFFRQRRVGKNGREFKIYKFRSMVEGAQNIGAGVFVQRGDPRITRVGKFIRRYSLDELPQLINVLKGEMSLVGPRPTLGYQVERYNARQKKRLLVKPGITGWAQVNGRSSLSWPERIELDIWYVENWSLWLDIKIMVQTVLVILFKKNIYRSEDSTEDPVSGSVSELEKKE